ncbi:MAG: endonuclease, partial [Pseudomonadota bacterium]|nr:endonuclease [Pseudomonadota bacterium]
MRRLLAVFILSFLLTLLSTSPVLAWSGMGHRMVGELAQRHLSPASRAEVALLLAGEPDPTLGGVAMWADALRSESPELYKLTSSWHYI